MADDKYKSGYYGEDMDQAISLAKNALPKSGGTMTGALTLNGNPTSDLHAASKMYVDDAVKNVPGGGGGSPDAVLYTAQELTEEQQAQARANISAASGDWILLADITTTAEVNGIHINRDTNGNSFKCSKIVAFMTLPTALTGGRGVSFGAGNGGAWGHPYFMFNEPSDALYRCYTVETTENGLFTVFKFAVNNTTHFWDNLGNGHFMRSVGPNEKILTQFTVCRGNETDTYPIGTNLKVWGCKV